MGHSTSSGRNNAASAAERYAESSARVTEAIERRSPGLTVINRATFENRGNGEWSLNVEGYGGGQILEETGSSRDPAYGRGGRLYSARAWDADNDYLDERAQYFTSLNEAKKYIKSRLQDERRRRG